MLIPPASTNRQEVRFPFACVLLVILQTVFFFTLQFDGINVEPKEVKYYFQSELNVIEFPLYVRFLQRFIANEMFSDKLDKIFTGNLPANEVYWMQRDDAFFQTYLKSDDLPLNSLYYMKWQEKRREYLQLLKNDNVQEYGFKSAEPFNVSILSNLFVHANFFQFVANVFFLLVTGVVIEGSIGFLGVIICYFLGGAVMISTYCLLAPFTLIPLFGASGAVAGLVGMLSVLYGFKKVPLYYFNLKGIHSVEMVGILFLPLWLIIQWILFIYTSCNLINLLSQMAALIEGALLAFLILRMRKISMSAEKYKHKADDLQGRLNEAMDEIAVVNYANAKIILYRLLDEYPQNKDIYFQIFSIAKKNPASQEYHNIVHKIFLLNDNSKTTMAMVNLVFNNYVRYAQPTMKFDLETFFSLLQRFRKAGYYEDAEKILGLLLKYNKNDKTSEMLAREHLLLARGYFTKNDTEHGNRLLVSLSEIFPQSESAQQAKAYLPR